MTATANSPQDVAETLASALKQLDSGEAEDVVAGVQKAISQCEALPADDMGTAEAFYESARVAAALGMLEDVERALAGAVRICDAVAGEFSADALECAIALATHRRNVGDHPRAKEILVRLENGEPDATSADAAVRGLHLFATIHHEMGASEDALRILGAAQSVGGRFEEVSLVARGEVEKSLGSLHQIAKRFDQAEQCLGQAREYFAQLEPPEPERVAQVLRSLSLLCMEQGKFPQAERFSQLCLRMLQDSAPESSVLPELLADRAGLLLREGKHDEALQAAEEALEMAEEVWEPEDARLPHLLSGVAALYLEHENPAETPADDLLTRALGMNTELFGREHPAVASVLVLLGQLYIRTEEWDRAFAMLNRALSIRLNQGDEFIYEIANTKNTLGIALIGQKKFDDAKELLREAVDGLSDLGAEADPLRELIRNNIERAESKAQES